METLFVLIGFLFCVVLPIVLLVVFIRWLWRRGSTPVADQAALLAAMEALVLRWQSEGALSPDIASEIRILLIGERKRGAAPAQPALPTLSAVPAQGPAPTVAAPAIVLTEPRVREPAQLVVEAGPDVPLLMRPSANPMSAGTYAIDRGYSVGDEVVYLQSDPVYGGATKKLTWRVTKVDLDADRVEINDGFIVLDSMGNPLAWDGATYEPRLQAIPAEVQVGKRWTTRFRFQRGAERSDSYYDYVVVARERVKLPFGEVEAFRIDGEGFNNFGSRLTIRHWLVPGVNYSLRTDTIRYDGRSMRAQYSERREMVSCRQMRWRQA